MTNEERIAAAKTAYHECVANPSRSAYCKFDNLAKGFQFFEIGVHASDVNELWLKVQAIEEAKVMFQQCRNEQRWGDYDEFTHFMSAHGLNPENIGETSESVLQVEQICKSN